jgi:hypothetical protein
VLLLPQDYGLGAGLFFLGGQQQQQQQQHQKQPATGLAFIGTSPAAL